VPNYICSAVCICLTGFFLAPIYPAEIVLITELIPEELHVGVIGLFGTIGGAGAAFMPFMIAAVADRVSVTRHAMGSSWLMRQFGFWVFGPFMASGIAAQLLLWFLVPRRKVRS
jgi:MFS family permease